jgi:hypothetical protein
MHHNQGLIIRQIPLTPKISRPARMIIYSPLLKYEIDHMTLTIVIEKLFQQKGVSV